MIPDWLTVPLVHVNTMDARLIAVALKFVGASGARPCTAIVAVVVLVALVPFVFHRHAKPIAAFTKAWKTACAAAACPGRIPHDFRRTAVRNMVRSGVPERVAMPMTGHKTRSVFERYNIVCEADLFDAARRYEFQKLASNR